MGAEPALSTQDVSKLLGMVIGGYSGIPAMRANYERTESRGSARRCMLVVITCLARGRDDATMQRRRPG